MLGKQHFITKEGMFKLEAELEYLRSVRRHEVAENIRLAKERGGTANNAEYDDAKNELALVEGRIFNLENMIDRTLVTDAETSFSKVGFGSKVRLRNRYGKVEQFTIVGSVETNPTEDKISNESPVGRAILGHSVGEEVEVPTPGGIVKFTIMEIS
jgi:transcription elongation factor GreA